MKITHKIIRLLVSLYILILTFSFYSCKKQETKEILIGKISHTDFIDNLEIDGVVESVRSASVICPRGPAAKIIYIIEDGTIVKEGDVLCILESEDLQRGYDETLTQVENAKANRTKNIAYLDMQYALLDAQVKSNAAQTSITNLDSLQLKYLSPNKRRIKELELQKSAIEKAKLERKLKSLDIINKSQIRNLDIRLQSLEFRVANAKDQLDKLSLKSTQSGVAFRSYSWITGQKLKDGDQAWGGMPLITIPDYSEMKVIIKASESSYKQIDVDDSVEYSFDAMPGNSAHGKILKKAPIGQPIKENSKVKFFEIEASMDKILNLPEPGLTAHCTIIMQRVRDTIVVPQIAIFDVDSMKVVYVKNAKNYEKRQVKIGKSSLNEAVISAGLTGYERISLIKPSLSQIRKTTLLPKPFKKQKVKTLKTQLN